MHLISQVTSCIENLLSVGCSNEVKINTAFHVLFSVIASAETIKSLIACLSLVSSLAGAPLGHTGDTFYFIQLYIFSNIFVCSFFCAVSPTSRLDPHLIRTFSAISLSITRLLVTVIKCTHNLQKIAKSPTTTILRDSSSILQSSRSDPVSELFPVEFLSQICSATKNLLLPLYKQTAGMPSSAAEPQAGIPSSTVEHQENSRLETQLAKIVPIDFISLEVSTYEVDLGLGVDSTSAQFKPLFRETAALIPLHFQDYDGAFDTLKDQFLVLGGRPAGPLSLDQNPSEEKTIVHLDASMASKSSALKFRVCSEISQIPRKIEDFHQIIAFEDRIYLLVIEIIFFY